MKNLKYYFKKAYQEKFAIGQFNFSDFSQVKGIVAATANLKSPIILGTSEGESKFVGLQEAVAMRNVLRKKTGLPIFLNLDHGKSVEYLKEAMGAGYDMVHFDGSKLSLEENIMMSKEVAGYARWRGVVVEGEVGRFGTDASRMYTEKFEIKEENLTKVEDAKKYMKETGVDVLAVSVGTFHGIDVSGISPNIRLDRLKELKEVVKVPFVLHGGSGTPEEDVRQAIQLGICKININTETRVAFSGALKAALAQNEIVPYKFLQGAVEAVQAVVEKNIRLFGSENKI
ncbi:MAG: class II fructose-bisphosphate aldolase [bacterium]|nr:class II fructose-bisphosphate aldolase [bacterium]